MPGNQQLPAQYGGHISGTDYDYLHGLFCRAMKLAQKLATGYIRAKLHILTIVSAKQAAKKSA